MSSPLPTITLFGATGGCINTILTLALSTGHTVNVLARTPSKLAALSSKYPQTLHTIPGDIHSLTDIKTALVHDHRVVDIVISGVGMAMQRKGLSFASTDPTICEDSARGILGALEELEGDGSVVKNERGPRMVLISTTGISTKGRDVPLLMLPLYDWVLGVPHADKRKMERLVVASRRRWVLVRPSFLMDGKAKGVGNVRVGVEGEGKGGVGVVGYVISREDVGAWIFGECVADGKGGKWEGKIVGLTY